MGFSIGFLTRSGLVRVGHAKVRAHFRLVGAGSDGLGSEVVFSLLCSESVPPQANIIRRFRPRVFSIAASPTSATEGLSSLVTGAMSTLTGSALGLFMLRRLWKRPGGGGGLGVAERDWLVTSPSLVSSAVDAMLAVLWEDVVENPRDVCVDSSGLDSAKMARVKRDSLRELD